MDRVLFQQLVKNYIDKYEEMNDQDHYEVFKWIAISHASQNWDLEAENFGDMFKEAMRLSSTLINNKQIWPTNGITFLCEQGPEVQESVREAFRELLAEDNKDYTKRLERVDVFIEKINTMIQDYKKEAFKFYQDRRTVINYLNCINPTDNYIYKYTEAHKFSVAMDCSQEIEQKRRFDLGKYYQMCDEIAEEIQFYPELIDCVEERLREEAELNEDAGILTVDEEHHILAYDMIYCAEVYNLYADMKIHSANGSVQIEKQEAICALQEEQEAYSKEMERVEKDLKKFEYESLQGIHVVHKKYGEGTIREQSGDTFVIQFGEVKKSVSFSFLLSHKLLQCEEKDLEAVYQPYCELATAKDTLKEQIRQVERKLAKMR